MMRRAFIRSLVGALAAGSSPVAKAQRTRVWRIGVPFAGPGTPASNLGALKKIIRGARLRGGRERCLRRPVGGRMDRAVAGARRRARRAWRGCADHGRLRGNASREAGIRFECDRVSGRSYPVEEGLISSFARPGANISLLPIKAGAKIVDIGCGMVPTRSSTAHMRTT